jgi:hypothetical protein
MPIYLRLYYLKRLKQQYKDEKEAYDTKSKKSNILPRGPSIKK